MKSEILFLDSRKTVDRLLDLDELERKANLTFSGDSYYGKKDDFFSQFDLVIQSHFNNIVHQSIILLCKKMNILTVFLFDGVYDWANTYRNIKHQSTGLFIGKPFLHDYVFIVSSGVALNYLIYKKLFLYFY